ncbi:MAG: PAS domain-containing protein [Ardenticatenaceae bacterium]|nr:PAS domain-containing protein [Ardenticatenaceae bacterium]
MVDVNISPTPQFHERLWQGLSEGFITLDAGGVVTAANEAAEILVGVESGGLVGRTFHDFWPETLPSPVELAVQNNLTHKTSLTRPDGSQVPINLTLFPLNANGADQLLVAISSPSTVERFNDALSHTQRLAGVGILTAGVAHELVTPISIITNACSNVQAEIEDGSLQHDNLARYIDMVENSIWRCARIVGVLRDYTFDESQHMAVTELDTIVEDAMVLLRHQFRSEFRIELELDLADSLKSIVCDHNRMTQVLINLLINARDAMYPDGGTILIKTWAIPPENQLHLLPPDASANGKTAVEAYAFSVHDTGPGVAPAIMDKIFDPFFTTKPNGKGTGLGLFLAKQIVLQHNGRIWADNNPDGGATFTVVLPRKQ